MSLQFDKTIVSNDRYNLKINFIGFKDGLVDTNELRLSIYAYDKITGAPIFSETLAFESIRLIHEHLNSISIIRDSGSTHTNKFIELTEDNNHLLSYVTKIDGDLLKTVFNKVEGSAKQKILLDVLTASEINHLSAAIKQTEYKVAIDNLALLLKLETEGNITETIKSYNELASYTAGQPEKIFQNWIEKNIWTLGIDYIKKHPARKIGINAESDLLMETTDGFIDLIELKRPIFEIFSYDESHKSHYPSKELSKVIGQCLQYLKTLDTYRLALEKEYDFKLLKPRVKIIVGRTHDFNPQQFEALRMLNSSLNDIQIISYDYLHLSGQTLLSYYLEKN